MERLEQEYTNKDLIDLQSYMYDKKHNQNKG